MPPPLPKKRHEHKQNKTKTLKHNNQETTTNPKSITNQILY